MRYAPAPSTFHVPYAVPAETAYSVPNQESHGDIDMRDGNTVLAAAKSDSSSSHLDFLSLSQIAEELAGRFKRRDASCLHQKHAVAEYIPTPLAELERMKQEEKKRKKKKDKEYEPSFEEVKEKLKAGPSKRRLLSEDEISTLFEDTPEPKRKKVKEENVLSKKRERSHSKRASASPSKSPEVASDPSPLLKSSKKELERKSVVVTKDVETSSSATSNSTEDVKETSPELLGATKKRIARE
ncbi:hypothetical protein OSTOST_04527, partial [Ostertagia ostertagi]